MATPLGWDELDNPELNSRRYTMQNIFRRLGQKMDPWQGMMDYASSLDEARRRLDELATRRSDFQVLRRFA